MRFRKLRAVLLLSSCCCVSLAIEQPSPNVLQAMFGMRKDFTDGLGIGIFEVFDDHEEHERSVALTPERLHTVPRAAILPA